MPLSQVSQILVPASHPKASDPPPKLLLERLFQDSGLIVTFFWFKFPSSSPAPVKATSDLYHGMNMWPQILLPLQCPTGPLIRLIHSRQSWDMSHAHGTWAIRIYMAWMVSERTFLLNNNCQGGQGFKESLNIYQQSQKKRKQEKSKNMKRKSMELVLELGVGGRKDCHAI